MRWAGNAAYFAGEYAPALTWNAELEKYQIESDDRAGLATPYNNIGLIYDNKGEWDKVLEYYGKAEKIRLEVGDRTGLATTYNNIGLIYSNKGEWDKALEYYGKSEKICLEVGNRAGLASIYNNMAAIYRKKEDFNQAVQFGERSLQIALQVGAPATEEAARFGLAQTFSAQKRYQEAVSHLERCVAIDQQLKHPNLERDRQELLKMQLRAYYANGIRYEMLDQFLVSASDRQKGDLLQQINDWPRAIIYYESYLKKNQDSLSLKDLAQIQMLISDGYIKQSKGDSALPYLQAALQTFQKLNDQKMVGSVYNDLGSAHKVRQAWPEALEWLRKSKAHNRAVAGDSASVLGFTYYHLAEVFLHTQQSDSARYYVEKSLLLWQALGQEESVEQTRELREKILSTPPRSGKK